MSTALDGRLIIALHSPSWSLEKPDLGYNDIDDGAVSDLSEALNNNHKPES